MALYKEVSYLVEDLASSTNSISPARKDVLASISAYIAQQGKDGKYADLVYICTHNSRRSHFGQVWAQVMATHFDHKHVRAFSGGTEATAFHPNAIQALVSLGFKIQPLVPGHNAHYEVYYGLGISPVDAFSKKYNDSANPGAGFCAIMTCTEADGNCPFIPGAQLRVATPYEDPKAFDNTPKQDDAYLQRCRQIAAEIYYMFSLV